MKSLNPTHKRQMAFSIGLGDGRQFFVYQGRRSQPFPCAQQLVSLGYLGFKLRFQGIRFFIEQGEAGVVPLVKIGGISVAVPGGS